MIWWFSNWLTESEDYTLLLLKLADGSAIRKSKKYCFHNDAHGSAINQATRQSKNIAFFRFQW